MLSLLYTSRSLIHEDEAAEQLQAVLEVATRRNRRQGITGALVFTGIDFAQILEGPEEGVANVMASILIDPRHVDVSIVRRETVTERSFATWEMNLIAPDPAIAENVARIRASRNDAELADAVDAAISRMRRRYVLADA